MKTTKDLKAEIKSLKQCIADEESRTDKWRAWAYDLQDKLNFALERLQTIAEGRHYTLETNGATDTGRITAAVGLKKIARMRERNP